MSFFKSLLGKKEENNSNEDKEFTAAFEDALRRYMGAPASKVSKLEYSFKDRAGNVIPPSVAFEETYNEWKKISSIWDKRSVIYHALDSVYLNQMPRAQVIERLVIDRYPLKGKNLIENEPAAEDENDAEFLTAAARCYFFLTEYDKSLDYAKKALAINPSSKRAKLVMADVLHVLDKTNEAHNLYDSVMNESNLKDTNMQEISIYDLVSFDNDIINSSVYAIGLLSNVETNKETWDLVAGEFYHCPYFRHEHSVWLFRQDESTEGAVKLLTLVREYPSFKQAVLNAHSVILQFRHQTNTPDLWEEDFKYINSVIDRKGWERIQAE